MAHSQIQKQRYKTGLAKMSESRDKMTHLYAYQNPRETERAA
jgi:hypothetical protein